MEGLFDEMTNLYELSKTLRFELKPVGKTQDLLEETNIILIDKQRRHNYEAVRPYMNALHRDFIVHSLQDFKLNSERLHQYYQTYQQRIKDKKNKTIIKNKQTQESKLREDIVAQFDKGAENYLEDFPKISFKKKDKDFLYEGSIFTLLQEKYGHLSEAQITDAETGITSTVFDGWNKWLGYWTKFFETRRNFYKSDGTSTAIATRVINDNLKLFCDNLIIYEKHKGKIDFSEVEKNFTNAIDIILNKESQTEKIEPTISHLLNIDTYSHLLLQPSIDFYNDILGGKTLSNGNKLQGLNEKINKYRQDTGEKMPYFNKLQKQILSEKDNKLTDQIENEKELEETLNRFVEESRCRVGILQNLCKKLPIYSDEQLSHIWMTKSGFDTISHSYIADSHEFEKKVYHIMKTDKIEGIKHQKTENTYSFPAFINLYYIKKALENYGSKEFPRKERYYKNESQPRGLIQYNDPNTRHQLCSILIYELNQMIGREITANDGAIKMIGYNQSLQVITSKLQNQTFILNEDLKTLIKEFADQSLSIYHFGIYFAIEKKRERDHDYELEPEFYHQEGGYMEFYTDAYEQIIKPYNHMRNFITKKPWSDANKWKLNFESSDLLSGWSKEFESSGAYIFKNENTHYLGIIYGKKPTKIQIDKLYSDSNTTCHRFVYDFQKPDNKNTPRLFIRSKGDNYAPAVQEHNLPVNEIIDIYDNKLFSPDKSNPSGHKPHLAKLIDYFKIGFSKHESYKHFDFLRKESSLYNNIAEFYRDVERSCYKPSRESINFEELVKLTSYEKLFLFEIYNKDFAGGRTGKKNTHTLYFEGLFSESNMKNINGSVIKLSGGGEVFFRPKAIEKKIDSTRKINHEIITNQRYTENKFFLHFPIQINFKRDVGKNFNEIVNKFLANNPDINVLGIDRGEKHLAYYSVINQQSEILDSGTLNHIEQYDSNNNIILKSEKIIQEIRNDEGSVTDYELIETGQQVPYLDYGILLEYKEKKRRLQRQGRKAVEQIKDAKKGYISMVVKKLADLIIKHNAIIVFEDLNMRFKQIRGGIEKSIYQQLEKALIDKLNFLVDKKEINPTKAGHLLRAYQLTSPVSSFKDMGKQTGIIFYTTASYTSKIDPVTGWRPHLYLRKGNSQINKDTILKFDNIIRNKETSRFDITYDIRAFVQSEQAKLPIETKWTVSSSVERYVWDRKLNINKGGYHHYYMTDRLAKAFQKASIDISKNILHQISGLQTLGNESFFAEFIECFKLICQIRNTNPHKSGNDNDFILSPVEPFFDSRNSNKFGNNLPQNGDDNGAYNIARKGLIILDKINQRNKDSQLKYPNIFISNQDWDNFTTNQNK